MASPAEIARILPETLPEDFSEWDSENSPAAPPVERYGPEGASGFDADSKPSVQFPQQQIPELQVTAASQLHELRDRVSPAAYSDRDALGARMKAINAALKTKALSASHVHTAAGATTDVCLQPARSSDAMTDALRNAPPLLPPKASADEEAFFNQLRAIGSVLNTQEFGTPQKPAPARATEELSIKPVPSNGAVQRRWPIRPIQVTATIGAADAVHTPMFQSDLADLGDENQSRKKWMSVAVIAASFLLSVFLSIWLLSPGRHASSAKQTIQPPPVVAAAVPTTKSRKPSPSSQLASGRRSTPTETRAKLDGKPGAKAEDYLMPPVDSQPAIDQLTAAPRTLPDMKEKVKEE